MQVKELVTIEFRYYDKPESEDFCGAKSKIITVGVFDTLDEAIAAGNEALEVFENHFELNSHHKKRDRFSKNGGCFGTPNRLITNLAYLKTPFSFFAKITTLKYEPVENAILDVLEAKKRYNEYKLSHEQ
jgi:hypothetical protein